MGVLMSLHLRCRKAAYLLGRVPADAVVDTFELPEELDNLGH